MFIFPNELGELTELACDVCVVGSGAAGITLGLELSNRGINTLCISGGDIEQLAEDQELYRGHLPDASAHEPLEDNRYRVFGGSTTQWGGRLVPFDPIDFEQRDFVPLSGWPIAYQQVASYYPRAAELCESRLCEFEMEGGTNSDDLPALIGRWIATNRCERWSIPTDFGQRYAADLRQSEHIRVLVNYHCVDIELDESRSFVQRVKVQSRGAATKFVTAKTFVLACGGLENPRLLLAARQQLSRGIGNQFDMVGRCYMGHINGSHGFLRLNTRRLPDFYRLKKDAFGMYVRRRIWLGEEAQHEMRLMNIIAFPLRPDPEDPRHGDFLLSLLHLAKLRSNGNAHFQWPITARHLRNVLFSNPLAWSAAIQQLRRRNAQPRLPFVLPYRRRNLDSIFFQSEHAPNRESRLVLSDKTDEFGMPRLEPRVAFSPIDMETVLQFFAILDRSLREENLGYVEYEESELRDHISHLMHQYSSDAHHVGTTRMADNPRDGVVDADCRVHGVQNLYIAGSSVFPTSSHANPTLTLLAITLRLADHLVAACRETPTAQVALA